MTSARFLDHALKWIMITPTTGSWTNNTVYHNDVKMRELKVNLESLREGQTFDCIVSREGELHVYIDGVDKGIVWTGLPTHKPFWGVADVHGCYQKDAISIIWWVTVVHYFISCTSSIYSIILLCSRLSLLLSQTQVLLKVFLYSVNY